ncbi:M14 family zinc carboxypeptidase [Saccharopolyspora sp. NPDC050389]|uniref:M14 family zinc carboxypeptidase n=1 Tax=Saccharopolyspora sp. NPDC050389 TaxID=3155516 RepID=UPI0033FF5230
MDLRAIAADVPDFSAYPTFDELTASTRELAAEFPHLVRVRTVGSSSSGDDIECLTIGDGSRSAVVYAVPNSNEPIGTLTIEYLARRLCEDASLRAELDFTWHFVKAVDPDGLRLNEAWLKPPITLTKYHRHFFREAMAEEADLNFPIRYKTLAFDRPPPETRALMSVIDDAEPDFCYALHNAEIGGTFYYVSHECGPIHAVLQEVPSWFGLHLSTEPATNPGDVLLAPGISLVSSVTGIYDFLADNGVPDPATTAVLAGHGGLISDYLRRYRTFCLLPEVSPFDDPRSCDPAPSSLTRREVLAACVEVLAASATLAERFAEFEQDLRLDTRLHRAVRHTLEMYGFMAAQQRDALAAIEDGDELATVAEWHRIILFRGTMQRLRGMYVRMLDLDLAAHPPGEAAARLAGHREEAAAEFEAEAARLERDVPEPPPIRSAVGTQVCAGLAAAEYVRDHQPRRKPRRHRAGGRACPGGTMM